MAEETVLVIEDDPSLMRGLKDNFQSRGYSVHGAADGEAGLEAALKIRPDLVILDIMLPKLNGYEVCELIRKAELDMPIIMLTAKGQEKDIVRGLNLGADDYVTKPFSIEELMARSHAFLRRGRDNRDNQRKVFRFGDCEFDVMSHRLVRAGCEVPLTPKEFDLLRLFVTRPGRALTRDEIVRSVWGINVFVTLRSVDRCVKTLRKKIEPDPAHPTFIQTIMEVGYRFELTD
jgi:two-component system, OmpR family, alkaline phosphatase synthesis response regulator PhoP